MRATSPDFDANYYRETRYLEGKIGYWRARAEMYRGNRRQARVDLLPHIGKGGVFLLLYGLTYFPMWVWRRLH
jgi:hypothetical protein